MKRETGESPVRARHCEAEGNTGTTQGWFSHWKREGGFSIAASQETCLSEVEKDHET